MNYADKKQELVRALNSKDGLSSNELIQGINECIQLYDEEFNQSKIPRRNRIETMCSAEYAIYIAMLEVEKMPADERLTKAIDKLQEAKTEVGNYIDREM